MGKFEVIAKYGKIWFEPDPTSKLHSYKCTETYGEPEIKRERFMSHIVCCGVEYCDTCGKRLNPTGE